MSAIKVGLRCRTFKKEVFMSDLSAYGGLFLAALLAATFIPAQSEGVLVGLAATKNYPVWILLSVASVGNTLGSVVNWWLGLHLNKFSGRTWFPVKPKVLAKAQRWYKKYGRWSLVLCWVPFIGDPITIAAGVMRERFMPFLIIVGLSKTLRYVAVLSALLPFSRYW